MPRIGRQDASASEIKMVDVARRSWAVAPVASVSPNVNCYATGLAVLGYVRERT